MKEKECARKKTRVVDVTLIRELVVIVCCILSTALLAYLALTGERAVAAEEETAPAQSTGMRQFYLTQSTFQGDEVLVACASGYHTASIWEIADPSNLKYNTILGRTEADSGQGPPTGYMGWVRTGYLANSVSIVAGEPNCDVWGSTTGTGTVAFLDENWPSTDEGVGVWDVTPEYCSYDRRVWCIED